MAAKACSEGRESTKKSLAMARGTPSPGAGRGRGGMKAGLRPVDEQTRIDITRELETFQQSDATGAAPFRHTWLKRNMHGW